MANIPAIKVSPDALGQIGPFQMTNAFFTTLVVSALLLVFAYFVRRKSGIRPTRMQILFESILLFILDKLTSAFGSEEKARKWLPIFLTLFLFLAFANQFTLIPFVEAVMLNDVNLFRTPASHYSLPIIFAVTLFLISHVIALSIAPLKHLGNFVKIHLLFKMKSIKELPMVLLDIFLGFMDIIGEFAKVVSTATRLFGNLFAGGIIVGIIGGITAYTQFIIPLPFIVLGILSGLVQAFIFTTLWILFLSSTIKAVSPQNAAQQTQGK